MQRRPLVVTGVIVLLVVVYYASTSPSSSYPLSLSAASSSVMATLTTRHSNYVWLVQLEFHEGKKDEVLPTLHGTTRRAPSPSILPQCYASPPTPLLPFPSVPIPLILCLCPPSDVSAAVRSLSVAEVLH